jgi:hypothetical protein
VSVLQLSVNIANLATFPIALGLALLTLLLAYYVKSTLILPKAVVVMCTIMISWSWIVGSVLSSYISTEMFPSPFTDNYSGPDYEPAAAIHYILVACLVFLVVGTLVMAYRQFRYSASYSIRLFHGTLLLSLAAWMLVCALDVAIATAIVANHSDKLTDTLDDIWAWTSLVACIFTVLAALFALTALVVTYSRNQRKDKLQTVEV